MDHYNKGDGITNPWLDKDMQPLALTNCSSVATRPFGELVAATGWLPHTTRAALTGLRKRGYAVGIDRPTSEQQHNCSDCGVDRETDDARDEMNSEAVQKPVADEGADDPNGRVADETETVAPYDLAR